MKKHTFALDIKPFGPHITDLHPENIHVGSHMSHDRIHTFGCLAAVVYAHGTENGANQSAAVQRGTYIALCYKMARIMTGGTV